MSLCKTKNFQRQVCERAVGLWESIPQPVANVVSFHIDLTASSSYHVMCRVSVICKMESNLYMTDNRGTVGYASFLMCNALS